MKFYYPEGSTPLDPEEAKALIPSYISTQAELNTAEQAGILKAQNWAFGKSHTDFLTETFIAKLHKKMFEDVWKWAGQYRLSNKNIGTDWPQVRTELKKFCDDTKYWIDNRIYTEDEIGARFHHRLVWIHPFPNGNGRHARLMTDLLIEKLNQPLFTWGSKSLHEHGETRRHYIAALRKADLKDFSELIKFVRS